MVRRRRGCTLVPTRAARQEMKIGLVLDKAWVLGEIPDAGGAALYIRGLEIAWTAHRGGVVGPHDAVDDLEGGIARQAPAVWIDGVLDRVADESIVGKDMRPRRDVGAKT